jgi:hypothetical protein
MKMNNSITISNWGSNPILEAIEGSTFESHLRIKIILNNSTWQECNLLGTF